MMLLQNYASMAVPTAPVRDSSPWECGIESPGSMSHGVSYVFGACLVSSLSIGGGSAANKSVEQEDWGTQRKYLKIAPTCIHVYITGAKYCRS